MKYIIFILTLLLSFNAFSTEKIDIVIDADKFIINEAYNKKVINDISKERYYTSWWTDYFLPENTLEFFDKLKDQKNFRVSLYTSEKKSTVTTALGFIAEKLNISTDDLNIHKILSKKQLKRIRIDKKKYYKKDLTFINSNLDNIIYIGFEDNDLLDDQKQFALTFGKSNKEVASINDFKFDEFQDARDRKIFYNRLALVYNVLDEFSSRIESSQFSSISEELEILRSSIQDENKTHLRVGLQKLTNNWIPLKYKWYISDDKSHDLYSKNKTADTCLEIEQRDFKGTEVELQKCINNLPTEYKWKTENFVIKSCSLYSNEVKAWIGDIEGPADDCMKEMIHLWVTDETNKSIVECGLYDKLTRSYLKTAPIEKCRQKHSSFREWGYDNAGKLKSCLLKSSSGHGPTSRHTNYLIKEEPIENCARVLKTQYSLKVDKDKIIQYCYQHPFGDKNNEILQSDYINCGVRSKYEWIFKNSKATHCSLKDTRSGYYLHKNADFKKCMRPRTYEVKLKTTKSKIVKSCSVIDKNSKSYIYETLDPEKCEKLHSTRLLLKKFEGNNYYTCTSVISYQDTYFKKDMKLCEDEYGTYTDFIISDGKVKGCAKHVGRYPVSSLDLKVCLESKQVSYTFKYEEKIATNCIAKVKGIVLDENSDIKNCLRNHSNPHLLWNFDESKKPTSCKIVHSSRHKDYILLDEANLETCIEFDNIDAILSRVTEDSNLATCKMKSKTGNFVYDNDSDVNCSDKLKLKPVFKTEHNSKYVSGCYLGKGKLYIDQELNMDECLTDENITYAFTRNRVLNKSCSLLSKNGKYIDKADNENCNQTYAILDKKTLSYAFVDYFEGINDLSDKQVLVKTLIPQVSLIDYNAKPSYEFGQFFPRTDKLLYRGMKYGQFDMTKAFKALFGHNEVMIESKYLTATKFSLQNKHIPFRVYNDTIGYQNAIKSLRWKSYENDESALRASMMELNKLIENRTKTSLIDELVDRYSANYNEYGGLGLYTSVYLPVALNYGPHVAVIKEKTPRGVDMTWHAYKKSNGSMDWPEVDNGEYMIPLAIPASDIVGYYYQDYYDNYGGPTINTYANAMFRITHKNKNYIVIPNATGRDCVELNDDGKVYNCDSNYVHSNKMSPTPTQTTQAEAIAILALCNRGENCSVPSELFEKHKVRGGEISLEFRSKIESYDYKGKVIKTFFKPGTLEPEEKILK